MIKRKDGAVPCVLYGGNQPVHFSADERVKKITNKNEKWK